MSARPPKLEFEVNGRAVAVGAAPLRRLAEVLREDLGLTGTKVGCNAGDCGACTVLLDGEQVCACLVAVGQVAGRRVTTVEGLAGADGLNRLQRAFHRRGAAQCGICSPGMLMAASDLLARNPHPDETAVLDALGGVLCRCTGYRKIVEAVLDAANGAADTAPPPPAVGRAVGARMLKTDGIGKLTGSERYGDDVAPKDSLWLRAVRSPHARARFTLGSFAALHARYPGLVRVLTAADVPGSNRFGIYPDIKDQPVLAEGFVRFRGEAVLALVGDGDTIAAIGDDEIPIQWEPQDPVTGVAAALASEAPALHPDKPDNVLIHGRLCTGDLETGFAKAAAVAEGDFQTSFVEHAYIEPEAGYARRVRGADGEDRIEIVACTQTPYMDRDELALVLGLKREQVRIVPTAVGGGFGGKLDISLQPLIATAAWILGRPVRCVYTRPESMASTTKRHPATIRARSACDAEGKLTAFDFHADFNTGAYASWGPTVANRVPVHATGPYAVPAIKATTRAIYTNETPAGAFRGFGVPQAAIAHEALMDELAAKLGIDPLEFRRRNALRHGSVIGTGQRLAASVGLVPCLDALEPRWRAARAAAAQFNAAGGIKRRGVGIACMWYGIGNTSLSNPSTMKVGISRDGCLTLYNGAVDIGQGSNTIMVQICADALGIAADRFDLVMGDTDLTADAGKTSASRQTFVSGKAAQLAGEDLRHQILRLANAGPEATIALEGKMLTVAEGEALRSIDLATLPVKERDDVLVGLGHFDPPTTPLDADGQGIPYATYGFAAQFAEVEVDLELGTVEVRRIVAAHDVGRSINPTQVEGQIHGGIAQGLGLALMEEFIPGRNENLHDYLIPTIGDVPPIETILIEDAEPLGPYGAKGIGEPALIPTAPAILGAIHHATGVRIRRVPATPDRVRAALLAAQATAAPRPGSGGKDHG
ncbi:MAG TPA: molybdopterin cofactor-binding domain-containing protein [Alphaproteobacteria bacterium]|nr:molybdopterin cofactor-binding domain-containing protein [Alphaproteobacteria bacterium]